MVVMVSRAAAPDPSDADGAVSGTRASPRALNDAVPDAPILVECLNFDCEVCGAFYTVIEQFRADYAGEINYVVRSFLLPGHFNSMNAALAFKAAAQRGEFEEMYHRLFETQAQWGEQQVPHPDLFRTFAEHVGLGMDAYDAAIAVPATQERVKQDFDDGRYLGMSGLRRSSSTARSWNSHSSPTRWMRPRGADESAPVPWGYSPHPIRRPSPVATRLCATDLRPSWSIAGGSWLRIE